MGLSKTHAVRYDYRHYSSTTIYFETSTIILVNISEYAIRDE